MLAMLWANQILCGRREFADVPRLLKSQVKQILTDSGYSELAEE